MREINLTKAVKEIKDACQDSNQFSFVVGAGISCPEVPLAFEIMEALEKKCDASKLKEIEFKPPIEKYSEIMSNALSNPGTRWKFFKKKVESQKISISNLLLAQLLLEKKVGKIVISPNFDDFLTRALSLFQTPYVVYDSIQSITERFRLNRDDIQILYVHGTYKFYDMCNTLEDISKNAKEIACKLEKIFEEYSPIVIGYSGWEDDAIMKGLKAVLKSKKSLDYNIYWFCYEDSEKVIKELPTWLKEHPSVVFVVPEKGKAISKAQKSETDGGWEIKKQSPKQLYSEEVFRVFLNAFTSEKNKFFSNVLKHYETFMKDSLPEKNIPGIFSYGHIISEIEVAQFRLAEYSTKVDSKIKSLKDLSNNDSHNSIISKAIEISHFNLTPYQVDEFFYILSSKGFMKNLTINSAEIIPGIGEIFDNLIKKNEHYFKIKENKLNAAVVKAEIFGKLNLVEEEMSIYESIITSYDIENCTASMKYIRKIKKNIFMGIFKLKSSQEKLRFIDLFLGQYSFSGSPDIHFYVAQIYYAKGKLLRAQGQMDEAYETFKKIDLYENFHYPYLRECLAKSWLVRGWIFKNRDNIMESNEAFEQVIKKFGNSEWVVLKQLVEEAKEAKKNFFPIEVKVKSYLEAVTSSKPLINEERVISALNELEKIIDNLNAEKVEEIIILDKIIVAGLDRIINSVVQIIHVKALLKKAEIFCFFRDDDAKISHYSNKNEEALKLYDEIERDFGLTEYPELLDLVIESLNRKIDRLPVEAAIDIAETHYKLSLKYTKKGDKKLCLENIENALYFGIPYSEIITNSSLKDFFKDDRRLEELLGKYSND